MPGNIVNRQAGRPENGGAGDLFAKDEADLDPANMTSDAATDGQVPRADGLGGIAWKDVGGVTSVFSRTGDVIATTGDYTWAQIDKTVSDLADLATRSHTDLTDIGTNTHAQIDTHIGSASGAHGISVYGATLVDDTDAATARGTLGLGSAAVEDTSTFDAAGTAASAVSTHESTYNHADIASNTAARHDVVTVTDSAEIDFTLTGQDLTASLIAGSIDETKLDVSVNFSLDLADSALQPGDNVSDLVNDAAYITAANVTYENLTANGDVGQVASTVAAGDDSRFLSSVQLTDLTDGGDSTLHYHATDRDRANHTGTQAAATISDFDTEVSNNADVAANTTARHDAVTVTDSAEIDFTLTGQDLTASLIAGSIDETKLDVSVNASLDLADSALQAGDNVSDLVNDANYVTSAAGWISGYGIFLTGGDVIEVNTSSGAETPIITINGIGPVPSGAGWTLLGMDSGGTSYTYGDSFFITDLFYDCHQGHEFQVDADTKLSVGSNIICDSTAKLFVQNTTDSSSISTGALIVDGGVGIAKKLYVGDSIMASASSRIGRHLLSSGTGIEINQYGSGDRNANIDFHSQDSTDYDARIIRNIGANGNFEIENKQGTGDIIIDNNTGSNVQLQVGGSASLKIFDGYIQMNNGNADAYLSSSNSSHPAIQLYNKTDDSNTGKLQFRKERNGGTVNAGDWIGSIVLSAEGSTATQYSLAFIRGEVDGAPNGDNIPTRWIFSVSDDAGNTNAERFRIDYGGASVTGLLDVSGDLSFDDGQSVNEIVTTISPTSTDNQMPTAQAVNEAISNSGAFTPEYGGIYRHNASAVSSQSFGGSYTILQNYTNDSYSSSNISPVYASNKITINSTGIYKVTAKLDSKRNGVSSHNFYMTVFLNGAAQNQISARGEWASNRQTTVAQGFMDVTTTGLDVDVRIYNESGTMSPYLTSFDLSIEKVDET